MDISTLIKVIAAVGAILTAAKVIHDFSLGGQARRREEYRFANSPLLLAGHLDYPSRFMWLALVTLPCGGLYAYLALRDYIRITRSETLVKDQKKHRLTIQLES